MGCEQGKRDSTGAAPCVAVSYDTSVRAVYCSACNVSQRVSSSGERHRTGDCEPRAVGRLAWLLSSAAAHNNSTTTARTSSKQHKCQFIHRELQSTLRATLVRDKMTAPQHLPPSLVASHAFLLQRLTQLACPYAAQLAGDDDTPPSPALFSPLLSSAHAALTRGDEALAADPGAEALRLRLQLLTWLVERYEPDLLRVCNDLAEEYTHKKNGQTALYQCKRQSKNTVWRTGMQLSPQFLLLTFLLRACSRQACSAF